MSVKYVFVSSALFFLETWKVCDVNPTAASVPAWINVSKYIYTRNLVITVKCSVVPHSQMNWLIFANLYASKIAV